MVSSRFAYPTWVTMLLAASLLSTTPARAESALEQADRGAQLFLQARYAEAEPVLSEAIVRIESEHGPEHALLVTPLGFLGSCLDQLERDSLALQTLERARRISQAAEGQDNTTQLPLMYVQAGLLAEAGEVEAAETLHRQAFELVRAKYGDNSVDTWLALGRLAEWLSNAREFEQALILYRRSLDQLVALEGGQDTPILLPLLQGMASTYLAEGFVPGRSLPLLERVAALTDAHPDEFDAGPRIEAQLLFGDVLMRFSHERQALTAYAHAWRIAQQAGDQVWMDRLAEPRKVAGRLEPVSEPPDDQDYFVFQFDLSADGRPSQIRLLKTNAAAAISRWASQRFRDMRFRPAIVEGQAQPLERQTATFVY
jgi:tetratricopeptide (TPR) repeat protein